MTHSLFTHRGRRMALRASALLAVVTAVGVAQESPASPRWDAWLGCWQSAQTPVDSAPATQRAIVCVTSVETDCSVELVTVTGGRIVSRDTIDASGDQRPVRLQGCTGWRRGEWSRDGRRVFVRSEVSCGAGLSRTSTGILGITNDGEWLDVHSVIAGANATVRTARYRALSAPMAAELPTELAGAVRADELRLQLARAAAGVPVSTVEVIEAVQQLDTLAVQSWLIELGQTFELDGRRLVQLSDAGVPGSVTDVMIGVSYPERFTLVEQSLRSEAGALTPRDSAVIASRYLSSSSYSCMGRWDPMWMPPLSFGYYADDPCMYYGARGYGYRGYGYGYGYGGGYYDGYYGYYSGPVIVVRGNEPPHGKLVKGQGYTRGPTQPSNGVAQQRDPDSGGRAAAPRQSGSSGSTQSSSGSSSGGSKSSGGSSSTGRTAQKRGGG